jgi:MYXO-CTERM domain-containing protein
MDGTSTLGNGTLNGSGQATYSTTTLSTGSHSITAVYAGDATFAGSTSAALTQTVGTPSYTVSFNPTTVTVTAGQSGTTIISVTPTNGFNQQVSFASSGLPTASTCTFSPPTLTPSGASAVTTTLTIATNVSTASLTRPTPLNRRETPVPSQGLLALVLLGLGGLVRMRRKGIWKGSGKSLLLGVALLTAIGMSMPGCGGKSTTNTGGGKTPSGSSTISVNATAGSVTQNATFTLTVQ